MRTSTYNQNRVEGSSLVLAHAGQSKDGGTISGPLRISCEGASHDAMIGLPNFPFQKRERPPVGRPFFLFSLAGGRGFEARSH